MNANIEKKLKAAILKWKKEVAGHHPRPPDDTAVYRLSYAVDPADTFRPERFDGTEKKGILYRPQIVREMKRIVLDPENNRFGVFVKGPQGVGKSHSVVNLVETLRAEGHIVTFIPDCEQWLDEYEFVEAICRSISIRPQALGITSATLGEKYFLREFLKYIIEDCLEGELNQKMQTAESKIQWILVFDQLNRIFARSPFSNLKDVGVLPEPFNWMKMLAVKQNVHTIISASANNSLAYKDNHPGFVEYNHPLRMNNEEVKIWKASECRKMDKKEWNNMSRSTGLCPLEISNYLQSSGRDAYESAAQSDVISAMRNLLHESGEEEKKEIQKYALYCLLHIKVPLTFSSAVYDRKYSNQSGCFIEPVFPAVLIAYRNIFWDFLLVCVAKNESDLLRTCANPGVTNDVRGRLFELIVISRFQERSIVSQQAEASVLPERVDKGMVFETQQLPDPRDMETNTLFIPKNSNFPAIDMILKEGPQVWAIQIHVSDHDDVVPAFRFMCDEKGWFASFDNIFLVYLSPSFEVRDALSVLPAQPSRVKRPRIANQKPDIQISAICKDEIECLKDIQWPSPHKGSYLLGSSNCSIADR